MRWATLRSLGNSRAIQLSAIFPAVGYFILFNDEVAKFLRMSVVDHPLTQATLLDQIWSLKLFFLYFGLMMLGIGSMFYQWRCPPVVKKHGDWLDYVRLDADSISSSAASDLARIVGLSYPTLGTKTEQDEATMEAMMSWYALQSRSNKLARWAVTYCFVAGLALLAVPSTISAIKITAMFALKLGSHL